MLNGIDCIQQERVDNLAHFWLLKINTHAWYEKLNRFPLISINNTTQ